MTDIKRTLPDGQHTAGLYRKFFVNRTDGRDMPGGDRFGAEYFVLDVSFDPHAKAALTAYVASCKADYPQLAEEMVQQYGLEVDPGGEVIDLIHVAYNSLAEAASRSKWMPPEYCANDWLADCRDFLENGVSAPDGEVVCGHHTIVEDSRGALNCVNCGKRFVYVDADYTEMKPAPDGEAVAKVRTVGGYPDDSVHVVEWLVPHKSIKDGDLLYTRYAPVNQLVEALKNLAREYEGYFEGAPESNELIAARRVLASIKKS